MSARKIDGGMFVTLEKNATRSAGIFRRPFSKRDRCATDMPSLLAAALKVRCPSGNAIRHSVIAFMIAGEVTA